MSFRVYSGGGGFKRLLSPNPTTVLAVLLLWLWLLLSGDNYKLQVLLDLGGVLSLLRVVLQV